jgi:hypothetical protein
MFFPSWTDFIRVWPGLTDFTGFRVLNPILHVLYVLTRKIVQFYESKRDFDNLAHNNTKTMQLVGTQKKKRIRQYSSP